MYIYIMYSSPRLARPVQGLRAAQREYSHTIVFGF